MKGNKIYRHKSNPEEKLFHDKFVELCEQYPDHIHRIIHPQSDNDKIVINRLSKKEKNIVVSAIQWLGSPIGLSFLRDLGYYKTKEIPRSHYTTPFIFKSKEPRDFIFNELKEIISNDLRMYNGDILSHFHLRNNLYMDSLDIATFGVEIERKYKIIFNNEIWNKFQDCTLDYVVDSIINEVKKEK